MKNIKKKQKKENKETDGAIRLGFRDSCRADVEGLVDPLAGPRPTIDERIIEHQRDTHRIGLKCVSF